MTQINPNLQLNQLVILRSGKIVYDQKFGDGLNVISGDNGSGKSTIADFIFYALGGDVHTWKDEAATCDRVYAEVTVNGEIISLARDISTEKMRPMDIYNGQLQDAMGSAATGWQRYSYASQGSKLSFSQHLFNLLDIPEYRGGLDARITMHQLLRLIYVDQITPFTKLFMLDSFDSALLRQAVGDLLLGVYDDKLYVIEEDIRSKKAELESITRNIRYIFQLFKSPDDVLNLDKYDQILSNRRRERQELYQELQRQQDKGITLQSNGDKDLHQLGENLRSKKDQLTQKRKEIEQTNFLIADSEALINALERSIQSAEETDQLASILGRFEFEFCPSCLTPVSAHNDGSTCHLCKEHLDDPEGRDRRSRVSMEVRNQINESAQILKNRIHIRNELSAEILQLERDIDRLKLSYEEHSKSIFSEKDRSIAEVYRKIGYLDSEIAYLEKNRDLAARLREMSDRKSELNQIISKLEDEKEARRLEITKRQEIIKTKISDYTRNILENDLPREEAFINPGKVDFDFGENSVDVDGRSNFSASSNVLLKNSLHFAMHLASLDQKAMRYPRFTLMDNIEDKGMEEIRSHNFQDTIRNHLDKKHSTHQIIITTSMISPNLKNTSFQVGPHYTQENKTLRIN